MTTLKSIPLAEYINRRFNGNRAEFARHMGVFPHKVSEWVKKGWVVVGGQLYGPRRGIPELK